MGAFQWLMKIITKVFGRSTNALFYTLLYREILKEVNQITNNYSILDHHSKSSLNLNISPTFFTHP